ncbi:hypothetical protein J4447_00810 [Candidatus Pacearchaeota archaeon]|nr:hypothetical protein [Candidatus Pacearchaeota archaeon]
MDVASVKDEFRKTVEYKGFSIEFIIPGNIKNYIDKTGFDLEVYLTDTKSWFLEYLFEILDWDRDGVPDREFGSEFKVLIYGVVDKIIDGIPYGIMEPTDYDPTARVSGRAKKEKAFDELVKKMKIISEDEMSFRPDFQLIEVTLRKY